MGVRAEVFEPLEMVHELPTPARCAEGLDWVDEPWRKVRRAELELGERELKAALAKVGGAGGGVEGKPKTDADRAALMRVTEAAPWTPAAWRAIELIDASSTAK